MNSMTFSRSPIWYCTSVTDLQECLFLKNVVLNVYIFDWSSIRELEGSKKCLSRQSVYICLLLFMFSYHEILNMKLPQPSKGQPRKMVKPTQTISRQKPTNCLSVFDHFVGLALKTLKSLLIIFSKAFIHRIT